MEHDLMRRPIIQIAGVRNRDEADMLIDAGVSWLGFPLRLPVHREDTSEAEAAAIIRHCRTRAVTVLITYLADADAIHGFAAEMGVQVVQLHGDVPLPELRRLRQLEPQLLIVRSIVVGTTTPARLEARARTEAAVVDAFITDTFDPQTGARGATGIPHDWDVSRRFAQCLPKPVILAGGLTPANVAEAVNRVRPAGVDAHTGVEAADGSKCPDQVATFVAEARRAFRELGRE